MKRMRATIARLYYLYLREHVLQQVGDHTKIKLSYSSLIATLLFCALLDPARRGGSERHRRTRRTPVGSAHPSSCTQRRGRVVNVTSTREDKRTAWVHKETSSGLADSTRARCDAISCRAPCVAARGVNSRITMPVAMHAHARTTATSITPARAKLLCVASRRRP
eukprot:scaffold306029_cov27-Tisochrysis_lutea.AAC.4